MEENFINKAKIIRRGCKEAYICHEAFNTTKQEYLRIVRNIPLKGSETILIYLFKDRQEFEKDVDKPSKLSVVIKALTITSIF